MNSRLGFSLIEVVVATAIVAVSLVAVIGLLAPMSRNVTAVIDSESAARLASSVEREVGRLGFQFVRDEILRNAPIYFYATSDGAVVRHGPHPDDEPTSLAYDVNRGLFGDQPTGIARRDRYFLVVLRETKLNGQGFSGAISGSVSLSAQIEWPYRVPDGPRSDALISGGDPAFDPSTIASVAQRQSVVLFFSISP